MGTVKRGWIFTNEKLRNEAKSLIICIWSNCFLPKNQIIDLKFPSPFYSAIICEIHNNCYEILTKNFNLSQSKIIS
jgi:hypothetical protein